MSELPYELFVACAPGLEPWLCSELTGLGLVPKATRGGAELNVELSGVYRVLLGCGLGLRALLRIARFRVVRFAQLERELMQLTWDAWLPASPRVAVKVTARKSRLYHSGAIAERVQRVLSERMDARPADKDAEVCVFVRIEHDQCMVSLDLCGSPMQQRGYRQQTAKAPLREDLARALLMVAGYDGSQACVDPLCGSGTLAIEAAMLSMGLAPGRQRSFAVQHLAIHDSSVEQAVHEQLVSSAAILRAPIIASDRDQGAVAAAQGNAARANVLSHIQISCRAISNVELPASSTGGLIVCNPPYGKRMGRAEALRDLYAAIGRLRQSAPADYRLALVTSDPQLAAATGINLASALMTDFGGIKVRFYVEG